MNGKISTSGSTSTTDRGRSSLKTRLRNRLTAGLVLVVPIWITVLLVGFVFGLMRDASLWIVEGLLMSPWTADMLGRVGLSSEAVRADGIEALPSAVRWALAAFSALLTVVVIYVLGMITTNIVGRRIVQTVEALVDRVPFVKTIYRASKQVLETFAGESTQSFQRVVSVPFPSPQVRTVGFITRVTKDPRSGEELCAVFVATAPNPTTGFVLLVKRRELIDLNWTVEEAVRVVMSGGVLLPDQAPLPAQAGGG
ncbi:MAG TPA: DUF502 domain-containing protein [Phycisphaerae bacterium]|nr:DUF502 domain-containing protein [Phycisphaerae bacterium]